MEVMATPEPQPVSAPVPTPIVIDAPVRSSANARNTTFQDFSSSSWSMFDTVKRRFWVRSQVLWPRQLR